VATRLRRPTSRGVSDLDPMRPRNLDDEIARSGGMDPLRHDSPSPEVETHWGEWCGWAETQQKERPVTPSERNSFDR